MSHGKRDFNCSETLLGNGCSHFARVTQPLAEERKLLSLNNSDNKGESKSRIRRKLVLPS